MVVFKKRKVLTVTNKKSAEDRAATYLQSDPIYAPVSGPGVTVQTNAYGPTRSNRPEEKITRIDYNPEICKDYKETGYCGYGDTCIFIHDRSNYKEGWQIEKEWEEKQKRAQEKLRARMEGTEVLSSDDSDECDSDSEELPFACHICRTKWDEFNIPMATPCSHYFCEKCIFEHYKTNPTCPICKKAMNGTFNMADRLLEKVAAKTARYLQMGKKISSSSSSDDDQDDQQDIEKNDDTTNNSNNNVDAPAAVNTKGSDDSSDGSEI